MTRRATVALVGLVLAFGAGSIPASAQQEPVPAAPAARQAAADARTERQRIVEFWTPARRSAAIPVHATRPQPAKGKPGGTPGGGGGGGGTSGTVTGAPWTQGGDVTKTTGKVFFRSGPSLYVCSGSVVDSAFGSLVLTAGHCVHDGNGGAFHTEWIFYPGYKNGPDPILGEWTATDLFTTTTWANTNNGFADDLGLAAVVGPAAGVTLEQSLGSAAIPTIAFNQSASGVAYTAFGYPAAKKYKGQTLVYCQGPVTVGLDGASSLAMACDMTGGSSGGPWFRDFANVKVINSLNSYGYASLSGYMFGPIFDTAEQTAYNASSSSGDCSNPSGDVCVDYTD